MRMNHKHSEHSAAASTQTQHFTPVDMPAGTIYTCPMHPQVRQAGPGHCPICGMALEPEMPGEHDDDSELRAVQKKFWIALALTIPAVAIAMVPHVVEFHFGLATARVLRASEWLVSTPVVL